MARTAGVANTDFVRVNIHGSTLPVLHKAGIHHLSTSLLSPSVSPATSSFSSSVLPGKETCQPSVSPSMDTNPSSSSLPSSSPSAPPSLSFPLSEKSYVRHSRKIRGQAGGIYGWFESEDVNPLSKPPSIKGIIPNDLFIHNVSGEIQIWLWTAKGDWRHVIVGEPHPLLPTHCLIINNGKPRWVTRQTVATYACRGKRVRFEPRPSSTEGDSN